MRRFRMLAAFAAVLLLPLAVPAAPVAAAPGVAAAGSDGTYYPVGPTRMLDTRSGFGAPQAPIGPGGIVRLAVAGRAGLPTTGVAAVVLNITATSVTGYSYLTVYPTGLVRPTVSNLNTVPGWTGANSATVRLGTGGQVDIYNNAGNVEVIADIVGYYATADIAASYGVGTEYFPLTPTRVTDTRGDEPLASGFKLTQAVDLNGDDGEDYNAGVRAFVLNVTVTEPAAAGYLTAYSGAGDPPNASSVNFAAGATVPNLVIVPAATCTFTGCGALPSFAVFNGSGGNAHVVLDIVGFYGVDSLPAGLRFRPLAPTRIVDTRFGLGWPSALGPVTTATVQAPSSVTTNDTYALVTNVTAVSPTPHPTFITVWPAGYEDVEQPAVSNLNPQPGQVIPNSVFTEVGPEQEFHIYNNAGTVNVLVDVAGSFELLPGGGPPPAGATARSGAVRPDASAGAQQRTGRS